MEKIYYSIAEVAEMFDINTSALRYWEKEKLVKPRKTVKGTRQYTKEDIENIRVICHLTKEKKLTLDGVKRELAANRKPVESNVALIHHLQNVKNELLALKNEFEEMGKLRG
jgi:DNA-binding transcriptional MerR regulator